MSAASLSALVQRFFTQRLLEQQGLSSHTVASYRDTFRLLLAFATKHTGRAPSKLLNAQPRADRLVDAKPFPGAIVCYGTFPHDATIRGCAVSKW